MIKLLLLGIYACLASQPFKNPRVTENLEDPPRLLQCMRGQTAKTLGLKESDIWGFQGPFLLSGSPRLVEYYVRLASGYKYKMRFTTSEHNHWRLFHYVSGNGSTRIGAWAKDMWDEAFMTVKDGVEEPVFVDLVPCKKHFESDGF